MIGAAISLVGLLAGLAFKFWLAGRKPSGRRVWRAIGLDSEGLDLAAGGRAARLQFATPAHDEAAWRARIKEAIGAE